MRLLPNTASYLKKKYCHTFASTIKSDSFRILKPLAVFFTAESPAHRMMLDWNKYLLSWKWKTVLESEMVPQMVSGLPLRTWSVCLWASLCPHVTHLQLTYTWIAPSSKSIFVSLMLSHALVGCDWVAISVCGCFCFSPAVILHSAVRLGLTLVVSPIERHLWRCHNAWMFP